MAYLAPRWEPVAHFELAGIPLVVTRLILQWGYSGWQVGLDARWQTKSSALDKARKRQGELVPESWGVPTVLRRLIDDASWATHPIELVWGPFFPGVTEQDRRDYIYPLPASDAFWEEYAEPVADFVVAASLFYETLFTLDATDLSDEFDFERRTSPRGSSSGAL